MREIPCETSDAALPQPWVDAVQDQYGYSVHGHVVWCYDSLPLFDGKEYGGVNLIGYPVAIDSEGRAILGMIAGRLG